MNFIGIDVSKKKLDCSLLRSAHPDKPLHKVVENSQEGVAKLLEWVTGKAECEVSQLHGIMEATGPYHETAALTLFEAGCKVSVVNPAHAKHFAKALGSKSKNDKLDAQALARFGQMTNPAAWQPPLPEYRTLNGLLTRLQAIETDLRRERNRLEKLQAAAVAQSEAMASIERMIAHLETERAALTQAIETHIQGHPKLAHDRALLESIKGVGPVISAMVLAVLQPDKFDSAPQAAAYLGLVPVEHQSGSSVSKRPRLSKAGNSVFRSKLYMAAVCACQYNPDVKALYERLIAKGKCKMLAIGAAMRKLVHICFGVLKNQTVYKPQIS
jgi:transposase